MPTEFVTNGNYYKGTRFRLSYNFKANYSYQVYITAAATFNTVGYQTSPTLAIEINNNGGGGSTGCNGPESSTPPSGGLPIPNSTFYEEQFILSGTNNPTLEITTSPVQNGGSNTIKIRKIRIVEIPPPPTFSVSSSSNSLVCGTAPAITFTVANVYNSPGVTGYVWNIGSIPNGWLYNGLPASATINTTNNSLQLTPDCGSALSAISATATIGSNNYNSNNNISMGITQPSYAIDGAATLCSGSTPYTVLNTLCNSTVIWQTPTLGTLSSTSTNPTSLTYGGVDGQLTLQATVNACGVNTPVSKTIRLGSTTASDYSISNSRNSMYWCPATSFTFSVTPLNNAVANNFTWTQPSGWTMNYNGGGSNYAVMTSPSGTTPPSGTTFATFTEGCGTTITKSMFMAYSSSACNNPCFTYSPNPAPSYLNVNVASGCIGSTYIRKIELIRNSTGSSVYYQDYSSGNVTSTTIIMSTYPTGIYTLRIYDGASWTVHQITH